MKKTTHYGQQPYFKGSEFKPGGFFDSTSYIGNVRSSIFGILCMYVGRYGDLYLTALDPILGREVLRQLGRMQFHARIGLLMGTLMLIMSVIKLIIVFRRRRPMRNYDFRMAYHKTDAEVALRLKERAQQGVEPPLPSSLPPSGQRLRKAIQRWPLLHDIVWGWSFLLALSLLFIGHTLDGSPAPALIDLFHVPALDFFTVGRTPVSALNGIVFGALAYGANHALSKASGVPLPLKLLLNLLIGTAAVWAWYALTMAMGAPI